MVRVTDALCIAAALVSGAFANVATGEQQEMQTGSVRMCDLGTMQSPINLHPCHVKITDGANEGETINIPNERSELSLNYAASTATLTKNCETDGCVLKMVPQSDVVVPNMMKIPGDGHDSTYALDFCVLRMPSEHTVNHVHYPLEVQCHHTMEHGGHRTKRKGILSTFYEIGINKDDEETNSGWIGSFEKVVPPTQTATSLIKGFNFNPTGAAGKTRYYSYKGSNTTGDCMEDVDWYVMYDVTGMSQAQHDILNKTIGRKAPRVTQELYGRVPEGCHHQKAAAAPMTLGLALAVAIFCILGRS